MDNKLPQKNHTRRDRDVEETAHERKNSQLHEAAHVGVGIIEAVSKPIQVEDTYSTLHQVDEVAAVILKLVTVLALNFIGDGLNDALNPRRGR